MPTKTYLDREVELTGDGFFLDSAQWTREMVPAMASELGIESLTDRHWRVIDHMRTQFEAKGSGPTIRALSKGLRIDVRELYRLFPKGPAKIAAKLAGIPKPRGCI